ncbi:MAG TPA: glycosyltransferase [Opitutaceae bacterium]|nr:glycosyltransferase [Opitutaceae bacterium]
MKKLKIAVYYPWVYLKGGIERSMAALISRSQHDWTIFTSHYDRANTFPEFENFKIVTVGNVSVRRNMGSVLRAAARIATLRLPLEDFDAYVVWCDGLGTLTTLRNSSIPTFCICSTPLRPVYDRIYAREALRSRKLLAKIAYHSFKHSFRFIDRIAWKRFSGVVATSLEVKERIVDHGLYNDDGKMVLHYPGIDYAAAPSDVTYEPFFLVPGRISWTKNIGLAIDSFLGASLAPEWKLKIAGFVDEKSRRHLVELQQRAKGDPRIEFVVSPTDEVLNDLYRRTSAVLFTPLNEDWGITPLEAMMHSKPVIANNQGGPSESVIPGVTGWLLRPNNVQAWSEMITRAAKDPERLRSMGAAAREHVQRYDWSQFFNGVDDLISHGVNAYGPVRQPSLQFANS